MLSLSVLDAPVYLIEFPGAMHRILPIFFPQMKCDLQEALSVEKAFTFSIPLCMYI